MKKIIPNKINVKPDFGFIYNLMGLQSYLSSVLPPIQYTRPFSETTQWPWIFKGNFLVSVHFIFLQKKWQIKSNVFNSKNRERIQMVGVLDLLSVIAQNSVMRLIGL